MPHKVNSVIDTINMSTSLVTVNKGTFMHVEYLTMNAKRKIFHNMASTTAFKWQPTQQVFCTMSRSV